MSDTPDLDALAKRYLDLWQEELSRLSSDREVAEAMARTIELMNAGVARFAGAVRGVGDDGGGMGKPADAGGAAAAGAARRGADVGLERVQARVAALEKRVRELERGHKRAAKAVPAKPKSKPQPKRRRGAAGAARQRRS